jgi:nucleoid-associated protein YgaU
MGILDFLSKKSPKAPAPAGATETSAAPADALRAEIAKHGLEASNVQIAVDGQTVTLTGTAPTTDEAEKIALAVGNTQGVTKVVNNINNPEAGAPAAAAAQAPQSASQFYTVKSGDSLWKIAEELYGHGHGAKYQKIFEANRPLLKDPDEIFPGQMLRIPPA